MSLPREIQHAVVAALARAGGVSAALPVCRDWRAWAHEHLRQSKCPWAIPCFVEGEFAAYTSLVGAEYDEHYEEEPVSDAAVEKFGFCVAMWGAPPFEGEALQRGLSQLAFKGRLALLQACVGRAGGFSETCARAAGLGGRIDVLKWALENVAAAAAVSAAVMAAAAFRGACQAGQLEAVRWLHARAEQDPNVEEIDATDCNNMALRLASRGGHLAVAQYLFDSCGLEASDLGDLHHEAFVGACAGAHLEMAQWLYVNASMDTADVLGAGGAELTALFAACVGERDRQTEMVDWLMDTTNFLAWENCANAFKLYAPLASYEHCWEVTETMGRKHSELHAAMLEIYRCARRAASKHGWQRGFYRHHSTIDRFLCGDYAAFARVYAYDEKDEPLYCTA